MSYCCLIRIIPIIMYILFSIVKITFEPVKYTPSDSIILYFFFHYNFMINSIKGFFLMPKNTPITNFPVSRAFDTFSTNVIIA